MQKQKQYHIDYIGLKIDFRFKSPMKPLFAQISLKNSNYASAFGGQKEIKK